MQILSNKKIGLSKLIFIVVLMAVLIFTAYFAFTTHHYAGSLNRELITKHHARMSYNINIVKDEVVGYILMEEWEALNKRLKDISQKGEGVFQFIHRNLEANNASLNHEKGYDWALANNNLIVYEEIKGVEGQLLGHVFGSKKIDDMDPFLLKQLFFRFAVGYVVLFCIIFFIFEIIVTKYFVTPVNSLLSNLKIENIQNIDGIRIQNGNGANIRELSDISANFKTLLSKLVSSLAEKEFLIADLNKKEGINQTALQVAHDIRSPLSAMQVAVEYFGELRSQDPEFPRYANL